MRDRRKRNIIIGSLCALLVFMGIGYAIISQMLTIKGVSTVAGDWNIYIDSITPNAVGTGVSVSESVGIDKVSASFEANLYAPGDKVEYKVVVKNDGNIDAKLGAVNQHVSNDTDNIVKYSNTLEQGYILRHGESYVFYVTTELPEELEELPENTVRAVLDLKLNFTQYTGSGSGGEEEDTNRVLLKSGGITSEDVAIYYGKEILFWNYYSNGNVEIVGNENLDVEYPYLGRGPLVKLIFDSIIVDMGDEQQNFAESLGNNVVMLYPFISGGYKTVARLAGYSVNNREEYLNSIRSYMPNLYDGIISFINELDELGYKEINKVDIIANTDGISYSSRNLLAYLGPIEVSASPSLFHIIHLKDTEVIIDLRKFPLITQSQYLKNCYSYNFSGTIYAGDDFYDLSDENAGAKVIDAIFYFSSKDFVGINSSSSSNNSLFFYYGEDDLTENAKTNIQRLINLGVVSHVYYGCDDVTIDSCNKR